METQTDTLLNRLRDKLRLMELTHRVGPEAELVRAKIRILEDGGKAALRRLTRDGREVEAALIQTRYGLSWKFPDGSWVKNTPAALGRYGLKVSTLRRPAWACLTAGRVEVYPSAENYLERGWE